MNKNFKRLLFMLLFEIALTNESKKGRVEMDVTLDNEPLIQNSYFEYYNDPLEGTPDKKYQFKTAAGKHVIKVTANNGKQVFTAPLVVGEKGLYVDLRYRDGESPKKQKNYEDGRILIQEGHFYLLMAPPGVVGYD